MKKAMRAMTSTETPALARRNGMGTEPTPEKTPMGRLRTANNQGAGQRREWSGMERKG